MCLPKLDRHYVPQLARRVLLVEEDALVRRGLLRLLTLAGFETITATTMAGAVDYLTFRPDIVLTEKMLPDGSGLELLQRIRRQDETVAVAVLTDGDGCADEEFASESRPRRPDAVFRKPFDVSELINWMNDPHPRAC
jgi:DNA-binding response OmpR family regulator